MTVLVAAYSPEGFAIAADGRREFGNGDQPIDNAQKIWSAVRPGEFLLAYGWCGRVRLEGDYTSVDFVALSQKAFIEFNEPLSDAQPEVLFRFLANKVHLRLKCFLEQTDASLLSTPIQETIASALFVGYVGGSPVVTKVVFGHMGGQVKLACLRMFDFVARQVFLLSGSLELFKAMEDPVDDTLKAAADSVSKYTQDCVDNRFMISDCASFGGHVHVATVTTVGFSWVIPPSAG